jgi:glycosyltransferase involved in cell wall biosynthesis
MDVLVDLTPLDTISRRQGIGHYVAALGAALAALSPSEKQGLDIQGLTSLGGRLGPTDWPGSATPPYALDRFEMRYVWDRRWRLPLGLHTIRPRPRLFHATQGLGTPRGSLIPRVLTCFDMIRLVLHEQYLGASRPYLEAYRLSELGRYLSARRVVAISQYTADDLVRVLGISASKIDVTYLGVDHERFHPPRSPEEDLRHREQRRLLGVDQRPYFLYVGSTDPRKKASLLLSAFCRARLADAELIFAGHLIPAQKRELEEVWRAEGSPPCVRFLGFVPDDALCALLGGALALTFPSVYEGFGLPVLEAMASGCPVITTAASSLGEVAGDAALLVKPGDLDGLREAIRRIASDHDLRARLRTDGLARAARLTWRDTALATVDSYARALA